MPTNIVVPDLGESVVEATIAEWLKQEGEQVQAGEVVAILETDKVNLDIGAEKSGVLAKIMVPQGQDVKVGDVIGLIEESEAVPTAPPRPETEKPMKQAEGVEKVEQAAEAERATPVARRLAEEHAVNLSEVAASGPRGKVTKEDVQRHLSTREEPAPATPKPRREVVAEPQARESGAGLFPSLGVTNGRREERVRLSRRRRTIAERLVEAQQTAAMLTTFNEIDMSAMMDLRKRRQDAFVERYGIKLGVVSFFVKASIGALKRFPQVNAELDGGELVLKHYYDIGMAIGAEEGLVVPVLRDADRMSFAEIEKTIKDFAQRAQEGKLSLEELRGGTFTITNGGVFGSLLSTPILNPPQVGILGLHKIQDRPIALNGEVVIRPMMYVALTYDHRIIDGREAVQFLVRVKELIEDPESLLLEG